VLQKALPGISTLLKELFGYNCQFLTPVLTKYRVYRGLYILLLDSWIVMQYTAPVRLVFLSRLQRYNEAIGILSHIFLARNLAWSGSCRGVFQ